jgi:uncharacterized sulfatase
MPNEKGRVTTRVVELLDLYPTLAELAGLPEPKGLSGASVVPLLKKPDAAWDRPAYSVTVYKQSLGRVDKDPALHYVEWDDGKSGSMLYRKR